MPLDLTDDKSTLVQVMAWCRQRQAINWANNPDLCRHMVSLGHNELMTVIEIQLWSQIDLIASGWMAMGQEGLEFV